MTDAAILLHLSRLLSIVRILSIMMATAQVAIPLMAASSVLRPAHEDDDGINLESWLDQTLKSMQQLDYHNVLPFSVFHRRPVLVNNQ